MDLAKLGIWTEEGVCKCPIRMPLQKMEGKRKLFGKNREYIGIRSNIVAFLNNGPDFLNRIEDMSLIRKRSDSWFFKNIRYNENIRSSKEQRVSTSHRSAKRRTDSGQSFWNPVFIPYMLGRDHPLALLLRVLYKELPVLVNHIQFCLFKYEASNKKDDRF